MKSQPFWRRLRFALSGLLHATRDEKSFRTHLLAAAFVAGVLVWLRPPLLWQGLVVVMVALVLAMELVNTALENTLDGLHAGEAEFVRKAKDCAAAAVLLLGLAAVVVFCLMLADTLR